MIGRIAGFTFGFLLALSARAVDAPVHIEITATDPPSNGELASRAALNVRVRFVSAVPIRMQARGYKGGVEQQASMTNPAPVYPAGQGEAIAWLAFDSGLIDEVRVLVFDERWQPVAQAGVSRSVLWSSTAPVTTTRPPWVDAMNAAQQSMVSNSMRTAMPAVTAGDVVLFQLAGLSVPAYVLLQAIALWRRRGRAELAPLLVMAPAFAHASFAYANDSNLWPIFLIFLCPVACLYLMILFALRIRSGRSAPA